jgi:hypothetical protein
MFDTLPQDPFILVSYVNTLLRDRYSSLDELCAELDINCAELEAKLRGIGMEYSALFNRFY